MTFEVAVYRAKFLWESLVITKNLVMARLGLKAIRRYPLAALAEKRVPDPVKIVVKRYGGYGPAWDRFDQDRPRGKMN